MVHLLKLYISIYSRPLQKNASCRSKSFQDYGWTGSGFVGTLKSLLIKSTIGYDNYEPVELES